jgi:hypothetical protein
MNKMKLASLVQAGSRLNELNKIATNSTIQLHPSNQQFSHGTPFAGSILCKNFLAVPNLNSHHSQQTVITIISQYLAQFLLKFSCFFFLRFAIIRNNERRF